MTAEKRNLLGIVAEQARYNLVARLPEIELIPALNALGMGLIPWSPLGGGLLVRGKSKGRRSRESKQKEISEHKDQINAYELFCKNIGKSTSNIALAWLLNNPIVTSPIIGPRTINQLEESITALDIVLSSEMLEQLNEICTGPGDVAPEIYARW